MKKSSHEDIEEDIVENSKGQSSSSNVAVFL